MATEVEKEVPFANSTNKRAAALPKNNSREWSGAGDDEAAKRRRVGFSERRTKPLYYHTYLGLDKLLTAQELQSAKGLSGTSNANGNWVVKEGQDGEGGAVASPPSSSSCTSTSTATSTGSSGGAKCPFGHDQPSAVKGGTPSPDEEKAKESSVDPSVCPRELYAPPVLKEAGGAGAHDEHLFIIIHQAYELWFKQIIWELTDAQRIMDQQYIPEREISTVVARLTRIVEILRLLKDQFTILETMTPIGFLDFRDYLFPASGFQSVQWRLIEQTIGLEPQQRADYGDRSFCTYLSEQHKDLVQSHGDARPSLHDLVARWLERLPFLTREKQPNGAETASATSSSAAGCPFHKAASSASSAADDATASAAAAAEGGETDAANRARSDSDDKSNPLRPLWESYQAGVQRMMERDRRFIIEGTASFNNQTGEEAYGRSEPGAEDNVVQEQLAELEKRSAHFETIMSKDKYEQARAAGNLRFSYRAMQAALLINLYQEEPILNQASQLLRALVDIDELMTMWRQRHALMVHRMLGVKMGTGGSSGHAYLMDAASKHRIFKDLFNLSTYLIPRHELPPLDDVIRNKFTFATESA